MHKKQSDMTVIPSPVGTIISKTIRIVC